MIKSVSAIRFFQQNQQQTIDVWEHLYWCLKTQLLMFENTFIDVWKQCLSRKHTSDGNYRHDFLVGYILDSTLDRLTTRGLRKFVNKPGWSGSRFVCLFFCKLPILENS